MPRSTRRFDAVLFDLDGTLADTIPLIVTSFNAAAWHTAYVEQIRPLSPDRWANHSREVLQCVLGE